MIIQDIYKIILTGLYTDHVSLNHNDIIDGVTHPVTKIQDQYMRTTHRPASLVDIFSGRRLDVQSPPSRLGEVINSLREAKTIRSNWYFDVVLTMSGFYLS